MILPTQSVDTVNIDLQSKFGLDTLHRAVSLGNAYLVELLLSKNSHSSSNKSYSVDNRKHDFSLNAKNSDGHNALHLAVLHGSSDIVRILLRHGADTSVATNRGVTALHMAVSSTNTDIVLLILDRIITDNDLKQILHQCNEGYTALHRAAMRGSRDIVSLLLKNGADRSVRTFTGKTVLHLAVIGNNSDCLQLLMDDGLKMYENISTLSDIENIVDVNVQDNIGNTALHFAVILRKNDMIRALLGLNADLSVRNHEGRTPLHIATSEKGFAEVSSLLHTLSGFDHNIRDTNVSDHTGKTVVHHTTGNGEKDMVRTFLKYRADSKLHCKQEQTPLHTASLPNMPPRGNVDIEEIEVEAPDIKNDQNLDGEISFVNIQDGDGATALHRGVDRFDVNYDIVKLLLHHGADFLNIKNKNGETVLQLALQKADLSTVKLLMNKGIDVEVVDKEGWTLLMFAAKGGHRGVVKEILDAGADVSRRDEQGLTALHQAGSGYVVNILLKYGADIGAQSADGSTPLHYAIRTKRTHNVIEALFLACYRFDKKDIMGKTVMDYFVENMKSSPELILMIGGGFMNKNKYSVQFIVGLFKAAGIMEHVTKEISTKFTPCLDRICAELSKEVAEIKSTFIDNVSLYTVLNYQLTDLRFLTKPEIKIMLQEESLYNKFKYYHHLIQIRFDQAQELPTLLDELSVIFSRFLSKNLKLNIPSEVCRMILVRTSHVDVRKMKAIFKSE